MQILAKIQAKREFSERFW